MNTVRDVVGNRQLYAGTVQIDGTCGMIDIAAKADLEVGDDIISYSLPFDATQTVDDHDSVSGDQFGIIPMIAVPTVLFDEASLTHETSDRLTEQHIPHAWKISRANRTIVTRDPASSYVTKVESYWHAELIGVRSLVRIPIPCHKPCRINAVVQTKPPHRAMSRCGVVGLSVVLFRSTPATPQFGVPGCRRGMLGGGGRTVRNSCSNGSCGRSSR
jgi:hypothetical protein